MSLSELSIIDPILCLTHRDHIMDNIMKEFICPFESEFKCFDSSFYIDFSLF